MPADLALTLTSIEMTRLDYLELLTKSSNLSARKENLGVSPKEHQLRLFNALNDAHLAPLFTLLFYSGFGIPNDF